MTITNPNTAPSTEGRPAPAALYAVTVYLYSTLLASPRITTPRAVPPVEGAMIGVPLRYTRTTYAVMAEPFVAAAPHRRYAVPSPCEVGTPRGGAPGRSRGIVTGLSAEAGEVPRAFVA